LQREREVVQEMIQRGVDGVILLAPQFSAEQSRLLASYGLPIAMVNNQGAGETPFLIYNDDAYGIRLVTRHLVDLGHTRIAYLGNRIGGSTNAARLAGFREVLDAAGIQILPELVYMVPGGTPEGGEEGGRYLLSLPELPGAVVCYNDYLAVGVYRAIQAAGIRIPQDISVTGYDDITIAAYLNPPLTSLHQDKYELGAGAARMLLESLDTHQPGPRRVGLQGALVVRESTRRV
jgi:LacI family transcriptional regulator